MKKIRLQLDALRVESFETLRKTDATSGTVHAHDSASRIQDQTCPGNGMSCDYACITVYDPSCGCL